MTESADAKKGQKRERRADGGRFQPGSSGNPNGRPPGSRNRTTPFTEQLDEADARAIVRNLIESAKDGDGAALKIYFDRVYPVQRSQPITIDLPAEINTPEAARAASNKIIAAMASGRISPDEALKAQSIIKGHLETIELCEIKAQLDDLRADVAPFLETSEKQ